MEVHAAWMERAVNSLEGFEREIVGMDVVVDDGFIVIFGRSFGE